MRRSIAAATAVFVAVFVFVSSFAAQEPTMLVPNLRARTFTSGLTLPTAMAFIDRNRFFVLEKNSGQVKVLTNGAVTSTALDLAVNFNSERGLLGIALDPEFSTNNRVYLFWSCIAPPPPAESPFFPTQTNCNPTPDL